MQTAGAIPSRLAPNETNKDIQLDRDDDILEDIKHGE
jgi:hypothetical protein